MAAVKVPLPPKTTLAASSSGGRTRFGRVTIGFNVLVQLILLTAILLVVNGIGYKHFKRFDFSRDRRYSLSARTKQFLANLNKPAKLIVYMSVGNPIQGDAENLAQLYRDAQPKFLSVEMVDPYRSVGRAGELQAKYKLAQQENVVIVTSEDRQKVVKSEDMVDLDTSGEMYGQQPTIAAFKGEQAFTNALLEVTEGKKSSVYYVRGHGEPEIGGKAGGPLEVLGKLLEGEHLNVAELNLLNVEAVPADATLLMLLAPKYDLSERELKLIDDYWNKGGRIMVALNPDIAAPRLGLFLDKLGVRAEDDRILRTVSIGGGVTGIVRDVYAQTTGGSPVARELAGVNLIFLGAAQSLSLAPERVSAAGIKVEPLVVAQKGYWGEMDYHDIETTGVYFDKGKDKEAPLYVAATIEKGAVGDPRVQVASSRMITLGSSRFLESDAMNEADANFFLSGFNWLLSREQLIGIAPRQMKAFTINLEEPQIGLIFWITTLAIPAFFAFLGLLVWWRRRS